MKWAVEHREFDTGTKETIVRRARSGEITCWESRGTYYLYLDIVDTETEARALADVYRGVRCAV